MTDNSGPKERRYEGGNLGIPETGGLGVAAFLASLMLASLLLTVPQPHSWVSTPKELFP